MHSSKPRLRKSRKRESDKFGGAAFVQPLVDIVFPPGILWYEREAELMRLGRCKKGKKRAAVFLTAVFFCTVAFFALAKRAEPIFAERAAECALRGAQLAVARAAGDTLTDFENLESKTVGENGNISAIHINSAYLNKLRTDFYERLVEISEDTERTKMYITVGSLLGCKTFQGTGFRIPVGISYESVGMVDFDDEFISCGINQTKHTVVLKVKMRVAVVSAFMCETRETEIKLPVCENIIIGGVPTYYSDRLGIAATGE